MNTLRKTIFWIGLLAILSSFATLAWQKEQLRSTGKELLLPLRPVDPRSLIQGDYMRLAFADSALPPLAMQQIMPAQGTFIFTRDAQNIGHYARLDRGAALGVDEIRLKYEAKGQTLGRPLIIFSTDSFLFGEGKAQDYAQARYAIFHVDNLGNALVTGLADTNAKAIQP
ncbi:MAG: GDYXXLXY domain-containing protein [Sphingomonadales bacterium]|jgi:uncharacterized membrane-anchored protein